MKILIIKEKKVLLLALLVLENMISFSLSTHTSYHAFFKKNEKGHKLSVEDNKKYVYKYMGRETKVCN